MQLRLDKYLADMGVGTRSEVKQYIRKHQVTVNGAIASGPDQKVEPCQDQIMFQELPFCRNLSITCSINQKDVSVR